MGFVVRVAPPVTEGVGQLGDDAQEGPAHLDEIGIRELD